MQGANLYTRPDIFEPEGKYTEDVRVKYGTQTIDIHQQDPHVNVNLAEMVLPYSQIQTDQLVRYQVSYFDFPATNRTIRAGETIYLYAHVQFGWTNNRFYADYVVLKEHENSDPYSFIGFPIVFPRDMVANCEEIAQFMQQAIIGLQQYLCWQIRDITVNQSLPIPVEQMQMQYALQNTSSYIFDASTSKFGFICSPNENVETYAAPLYTDANIPFTSGYALVNVDYYIRIDPTLPTVRQLQLAKIFGGVTTATDTVPVTINNTSVYEVIYKGMQYGVQSGTYSKEDYPQFWQNPWLLAQMSSTVTSLTQTPSPLVPIAVVTNSLNGIRSFIQFSNGVSSILQSDYVYVRTNANSSNWNTKQGRKDNTLAILPWTRGFGEMASFLNHVETVDFAAVDNINAVKTVQLTLTDEFGELLVFDSHFTLRISVSPIQ